MTKLKFNPNDPISVKGYMESLDTQKKILENSMDIYATDSNYKRKALESVLRFSDLTMEDYAAENHKIDTIINASIQKHIPLTEAHQTFLIDMSKLVKTRINQLNDPKYLADKYVMNVLENQVSYKVDIDYVTEATNPFGDSMIHNLMAIDKEDVLTVRGLYECCNMLVSPLNDMNDDMKSKLKDGLCDKLRNTMRYECNTTSCKDFPVIQAMGAVNSFLKKVYADKDIDDEVDNLFDYLNDSIDDIFENYYYRKAHEDGFNPNPFNVYNLTPLPVAVRTIDRSMVDLINAETDEEITEALCNIGRIKYALESFDTEQELTEAYERTKGLTRSLARHSVKHVNKTIAKDRDRDEVAHNTGKIFEPYIKYLDNVKQKIKSADKEERRNLIIKGGVTRKVGRYITRGIMAIAAGSMVGGPVLGAIAMGITVLASFALDKDLDRREKNKILKELEDELAITEEKLEDCRGDEDKQKKYELMRIRNNLKREIDRINLGLKY